MKSKKINFTQYFISFCANKLRDFRGILYGDKIFMKSYLNYLLYRYLGVIERELLKVNVDFIHYLDYPKDK